MLILRCFRCPVLVLALFSAAGLARADQPPAPPAASPVFVPPKLSHFEAAAAPESLRTRGPVDVVLTIQIDDKGAPTKVEVKTSAGGEDAAAYDGAAVAAAQQFVFAPGTADGKPVAVHVTYRYHFFLKPEPPPPPPPETESTDVPTVAAVPFSGRVRRSGDRAPLSGVSVTLDVPDMEAITDGDGKFSFPAVPVGARVFKLRSGEIVACRHQAEARHR